METQQETIAKLRAETEYQRTELEEVYEAGKSFVKQLEQIAQNYEKQLQDIWDRFPTRGE